MPQALNMESLVYCGDRQGVEMEWQRRRYKFLHSKPVLVPDEFAQILLNTLQFCREGEARQPVNRAFPPPGPLLFRRWGALGDLLMFRAAASAFHRAHPEYRFGLRCQARFASIFQEDPLWLRVTAAGLPMSVGLRSGSDSDSIVTDKDFYHGVRSFDQVAEADHRGDQRHRVHLFLQAMTDLCADPNLSLALLPEDWQIPIPDQARQWVERHLHARELTRARRGRPLVAIQLRGSASMKALPEAVMLQIVQAAAKQWLVILIEPGESQVRKLSSIPNVHGMPGRDALHGIEMLRHVDLAIVMDSGPLWMAHCAPCPTLAILGPTRPAQRIALHPLYPAGARAVCLNDVVTVNGQVGCPACFEAAKACGGTFACMQQQADWPKVVSWIIAEAAQMLAGEIALPQFAGV